MTNINKSNLLLIQHLWQLAYLVWGRCILISTTMYIAGFALFGGNTGVMFGSLFGLFSAVFSLPAVPVLRLLLPRTLLLSQKRKRAGTTLGLITAMFFALTLPVGLISTLGADDANTLTPDWKGLGVMLALALPCWFAAVIATGYSCRKWLLRPDNLAGVSFV